MRHRNGLVDNMVIKLLCCCVKKKILPPYVFSFHKKVRRKVVIRTHNEIVEEKKSIEYKLEWLRTFTEYKVTEWPIGPLFTAECVCPYFLCNKKTPLGGEREKKKWYTNTIWSWFSILVSKSNEISFENPFS